MKNPHADYAERDLGALGLTYVQRCLAEGKSFAQTLARSVDFSRGRAVTYLPPSITCNNLQEFSYGDRARLDVTTEWVAGAVYYELGQQPESRVALFEHDLAYPTDSWLEHSPLRMAAYDNEVYFPCFYEDGETRDR